MDPNITITWQHAVVFLGGIALQYLATKLNQPAVPALPGIPAVPVVPVAPVTPTPQLGDGHVVRDILAQLIAALQQSVPSTPATPKP